MHAAQVSFVFTATEMLKTNNAFIFAAFQLNQKDVISVTVRECVPACVCVKKRDAA